jgi:2-amino-4-hydroxy-6-hydroxymethyldihydropteridine diphosphokinase
MQTAYIGMGANIPSSAGPPDATLADAVERLRSIGHKRCCSSLYSTAPVGFADQPRFLNAVIGLDTGLSPASLLAALLRVERDFGRNRASAVPNGPRTLDLDILLYGDLVLHESNLDIPHPRLTARSFVLVPLAEIAPNLVVVPHQSTVTQLLHGLRNGHPTETDAVVPFHSDLWRAVPCRGGDASASRPESADPHR